MTVDSAGVCVHVGDMVRVLDLEMELFQLLEPEEIEDIRSMIGAVLAVEEVTDTGRVRVTKSFDRGPGLCETHSLMLSPAQIERVSQAHSAQ